MLTDEQRMFAIEDARTHLAAQFDLIKVHDQKALSLLSLYVTLGTATVGLALTAFSDEPLVGTSTAWGLAGASVCLLVGAAYCFRTIERSTISLPGRGFDFWTVAVALKTAEFEAASRTYLHDGIEQMNEMRALNIKLAGRLGVAKAAGIAAPIVAAIIGGAMQMFAYVSPF